MHFILECPGYRDIRQQCTSIMVAAAALSSGQNLQQCMRDLFIQQTFAELAFYIRRARTRRFHAKGAQYMRDVAATPITQQVALVDDDVDSSSDEESEDDGDEVQSQ